MGWTTIALLVAGACSKSGGYSVSITTVEDCPSEMRLLRGETVGPSVVRLFLSLRDCEGGGIIDAAEADFTIQEDGEELSLSENDRQMIPQEAAYEVKDLLLLDMSGSLAESGDLALIQQAVTRFTESLDSQEIAIYAFDGREDIQLIADFTDDQEALAAAIASLDTFAVEGSATNLNGAVLRGLEALDLAASGSSGPGGRYFVGNLTTLTDGSDQAGRETDEAAAAAVQSSPHATFTVGIGEGTDADHLQALGADGSWTVADVDALEDAFAQLAERIQDLADSLYLLGYCSPQRSGQHTLKITHESASGGDSLKMSFSADGFEEGCVPDDLLPEQDAGTSGGTTTTGGETWAGVDLVRMPAGSFTMGCTAGQGDDCDGDEVPHDVTLSHGFFIGETELTQSEFEAVMGYNPSSFDSCGESCPVENVSWHEVAAFANAVSDAEGLESCFTCSGSGSSVECSPVDADAYACEGYRLPTEAEWEYAARCGADWKYAGSDDADEVAWSSDNSGAEPHPVGGLAPNDCGLYDMSGNAHEWVWDWYQEAYQDDPHQSGSVDPVGPRTGTERVIRGGSWLSTPIRARVTNRGFNAPRESGNSIGFRLARTDV